ncbi:MAG TPA: Na/Pi cotransporter family protein, partial [Thiomicrospira sp.]|nr:Na/Pi cotransporter family protein [Thiomicrospira sp.]
MKHPIYRSSSVMAILSILMIWPFSAYAQVDVNTQQLDWFTMLMWLFGGLALFLYGMDKMIKGLLVVAGDRMKEMLSKLTTNRVMGAITGA